MYDYYDSFYDYAPTRNERKWAMLCHLSAFSVYVGVPFGNILGPLVIWLVKRDESPFVDEQGKEAINFHLSMTIYGFVAAILCVILIGFPMLFALWISSLVLVVIAAVKSNDGHWYQYPITMRLLK